MNITNNKIFEIGFNKCATRAVCYLFKSAGIRLKHWEGGELALNLERAIKENSTPFENYGDITYFSDIIYSSNTKLFEGYKDFKFLDEKFKDAKFVYNIRPIESWIKSRIKHGNGFELNVYKKSLGLDTDEEVIEFWRNDWVTHKKNVVNYFESVGKLDKLLFIDITSPNFREISDFLGSEVDPEAWQVVGKSK